LSNNYSVGDVLETDIVKIIPNGLGLGFAEKLTLFVPLSVPGDRLKVEIAQIKSRTAFARIVEILEPSEDRSEPECRYFGECGGCNFQQMNYAAQMAAKVDILSDCLKRIANISEDIEIHTIPSPEPFGYRIRTQVHADPLKREIGFFRRQSHDVIEAETCPILTPDLDQTIAELRESFDWSGAMDEIINIEATASSGGSSLFAEGYSELVKELQFTVSGRDYSFSAKTFFQANAYMVGPLVEAAVGGVSGGLALDLYCGIGLFSLPLADRFETVIGVESTLESCAFAARNAGKAGLINVRFEHSRVRKFLSGMASELGRPDLVVVDPPRSGLKKSTLNKLISLEPRNVTYVSCNPSTLARDLRILLDAGYSIEKFTALDLFPQTHHVEAVVRLRGPD
jgi:23S rRNA (uracil1939-C5)-methyltransferase